MNRRRFVARTATAAASVTVAGYLGTERNDGANSTEKRTHSRNTTMTDTNDSNCPTFGEAMDEHVCSRGGPRPNAPVVLRPEAGVWKLRENGVPTFTVTLTNQSGSDFAIDTDAWTVRRKRKDSWSVVESNDGTGKTTAVGSNDEQTWSLSREQHPTPHIPDTTFIVVPVESGLYALTVTGKLSIADESRVECTALFEAK